MNNKRTKKPRTLTTTVRTTQGGLGFVMHPDFDEDIRIERDDLNAALNNDTVELQLLPQTQGSQPRGRVRRVVKRAKTHFVGVIEHEHDACFLVPDDRRMYTDILIPGQQRYEDNVKVVVELQEWTDPHKDPIGKVLKVLGPKGDHEVEIQSILYENNILADFPPAVARAARDIEKAWQTQGANDIEESVHSGVRRDFRDIRTCTIDPETAKDFDDALSVVETQDGRYEVGIHIADVSHYVEPDTDLDSEARERGFSSYLVDRTIPMLPPELSSDICSLNERVDRLTFSAVVTVDGNGVLHDRWFGKGVIHSDKRFSYKEAQNIITTGSTQTPWHTELTTLNKLSKKLRARRFKEGAIDFDQDEVEIDIDEHGVPVRIYKKERLDTHKLVEEWMLMANRAVAEYIFEQHGSREKERGFIYRVHDVPDKEKLAELALLVRALGYTFVKPGAQAHARDIGHLFRQIENEPAEGLIKTAMVRSMSKAQYTTKNIGHFGLGFGHYTHFTSPIRRYSDLLVHRVLHKHLLGKEVSDREFATYRTIAKELSEREIDIQQAERDSIKFKQVEYWAARIGTELTGIITGVKEWGVYVADIDTGAEGLVPVRTIKDDYYTYEPKKYRLIGQKTKKAYQLGDTVKVKVVDANVDRKTLDFVFV